MKMNESKSVTWTKMAENPTNDVSIAEIRRVINEEFGEMLCDDVLQEIAEDGIIV